MIRSTTFRTLAGVSSLAMLLASGCNAGWNAYADEPLRRRVAALTPDHITAAEIEADICPREPLPLSSATLISILARIGGLAPTPDVGKREPWRRLRRITLHTDRGEVFEIDVARRDSLGQLPIVILQEDATGGMGFYYGDTLWSWLEDTPESMALAKRLEQLSPCAEQPGVGASDALRREGWVAMRTLPFVLALVSAGLGGAVGHGRAAETPDCN